MDFDSSDFAPNNSLTIKIFKKLDRHLAQIWTPIEIQLRIQFEIQFMILLEYSVIFPVLLSLQNKH